MQTQVAEWPGSLPTSKYPFVTAIFLSAIALTGAIYLFVRDWQGISSLAPQKIDLQAYTPENGGWQGEPPRVESGRSVELTVTSVEGMHGFALGHTNVRSSRLIGPGESETVTFIAPAPGRYVLYCTEWCSPDHWRMRTTIEVVDPAAPDVSLSYLQEPERYAFPVESLALDAAHLAEIWPDAPPSAQEGAALWQSLSPSIAPQEMLAELGWPLVTPAQVFDKLRIGRVAGLEAAQHLTQPQQWTLVAYLWQQMTSMEALARAADLYQQNCADCHGSNGQGDGFPAYFSVGEEPDFTALRASAGASPALYYAKIGRGGMGTGMPNWGTILPEDDMWALAAYLHSFMFDYAPSDATGQQE